MRRRSVLWLACLVPASTTLAADAGAVLEQIRSATLDPSRAVSVRGVEIDMGLGSLELRGRRADPGHAGGWANGRNGVRGRRPFSP